MSVVGKSFLFYSTNPRDKLSQYTIGLISKSDVLKKMFYFYNLSDPANYIPTVIKQIGKVPVIIANGFNKPIVGGQVLEWVKSQINGIEGLSVSDDLTSINIDDLGSSTIYEDITASCPRDGKAFDTIGLDTGIHDYSSLDDRLHIDTHDERSMKKDLGEITSGRFSKMMTDRKAEIDAGRDMYDPSIIRDGGFETYTQSPSAQPTQPPNMPHMGGMGGMSGMGEEQQRRPFMPKMYPQMPTMRQPTQMYHDDISQRQFMAPPPVSYMSGDMTRASMDTRSQFNLEKRGMYV